MNKVNVSNVVQGRVGLQSSFNSKLLSTVGAVCLQFSCSLREEVFEDYCAFVPRASLSGVRLPKLLESIRFVHRSELDFCNGTHCISFDSLSFIQFSDMC